MVYEDATPTAVRLAGNTTTTKQFLTQTGTGTVSAAPAWGTIANTDVSGLGSLSTLNSIDLTANVGATVLPILNGGTGSSTQNFVDLNNVKNTITNSSGTAALNLYGAGTGGVNYSTLGLGNGTGSSYWTLNYFNNGSKTGFLINNTGTNFAYFESNNNFHFGANVNPNSASTTGWYHFTSTAFSPNSNNVFSLGNSSTYWLSANITTLNLNSTASLSGGTAGLIELDGVGTTSSPAFLFKSNYSGGNYTPVFNAFIPGLTTGSNSHAQFRVGVAASNNNAAEFNFNYLGNGSTSNRFDFGLYGNASVMGFDGIGQVTLANSGGFTASSGTQTGVQVIPQIKQTSTAGYTALLVNPTETTTGSGTKLLADFQVGGVSKLNIDNTGKFGGAIQQVLATGASHTVDDVITALQNLGLLRQT
jgi:hypothetical protein